MVDESVVELEVVVDVVDPEVVVVDTVDEVEVLVTVLVVVVDTRITETESRHSVRVAVAVPLTPKGYSCWISVLVPTGTRYNPHRVTNGNCGRFSRVAVAFCTCHVTLIVGGVSYRTVRVACRRVPCSTPAAVTPFPVQLAVRGGFPSDDVNACGVV